MNAHRIHHRTTTVRGHEIHYREAGPAGAPVLLLPHGFPTSSHMFRDLMPLLADRYHVIAPDHLGFGRSAAPAATEFPYSFARPTEITGEFTERLGLKEYALCIQDHGAPIGLRLALAHPERVTAIITRNGNAYEEGLGAEAWAPVLALIAERSPQTEAPVREISSPDGIKWQYLHDVPDPTLVSPDAYAHDAALMARPGQPAIQLDLISDYGSDFAFHPAFHEYVRTRQVPLQAVRGAHDEIFVPAGALAFQRDLPTAEIHLLPTGNFALETHADRIARLMRDFLEQHLTTAHG